MIITGNWRSHCKRHLLMKMHLELSFYYLVTSFVSFQSVSYPVKPSGYTLDMLRRTRADADLTLIWS